MDLAFRQSQNIEAVIIADIILFPNKEAADVYLERLFPLHVDVLIVSADGFYPENRELNQRVMEKLTTDPSLSVIVFGADSLKTISLATQKLLIMDDLITKDFAKMQGALHLDERQIITIIKSFLSQSKKRKMAENMTNSYLNFRQYSQLDWRFELLTGRKPE